MANDWAAYSHLFKEEKFPAKTILLQEGEIAKKIFFVKEGCMRIWFNNQGKDLTFQFFFEGQGVSSIESFRTNEPSLFTIETIEPCVIYTLSKKNYKEIIAQSPQVKENMEDQIFQRLVFYQKLFLSRIKDKPEKRYQELIKDHPEILKRVPQQYIASYLGITAVSLSRIRKRK